MKSNVRRTHAAILGLLLAGLTLSYTATADVTTTLDSVIESGASGFEVSTVVARIHSDDPDANTVLGHFLKKEFKKQGVTVYLHDDIFPATQSWNEESMRRVYEARGIDGVMLVQLVSEVRDGSSTQAGRVRYSETSMPTRSDQPSGRYGGGPAAAVGFSEGVRGYGEVMHAQTARYQVELVDWAQGREVWRSDVETRVTGNRSRNQQMAKGTALGIIRGLTESDHLLVAQSKTP